jgi:hypothetical protein
MKTKFIYIFWAVILFLVGIAFLPGIFDLKQLSTENWVAIETGVALAFVITYFLDGIKKWGWLLPAFIFAGMAIDLSKELDTLFNTQPNGVPIMIGIAIWFLVGFLIDRKRWWLLIPAYGLIIASVETTINTMVAPSALYVGNSSTFLLAYSSGAGIMLMLSLPFFVVYVVSKKSWWALIPAGILTSTSVMLALQVLTSDNQISRTGLYIGVLFLGLAATFGILWLRRKTQPTRWAIFPAAGLFVLAILAFIFGNGWNTLSDQTKAICFAAASVACFIGYFVHGLRKWGWLFPALICAAFAALMWMSINNMDDSPLMIVLILLSVAIPFYVGFIVDRKHWGLLIPAVSATLFMILLLVDEIGLGTDAWILILFALPFFLVYFLSNKNWWAFIPAGILASFGLVNMLEYLIPHEEYASLPGALSWDVFIPILFLGFAATFGVLWLRRNILPTGWTGYPALGFLMLAILSFVLRERFQEYWLSTIMLVIASLLVLAVAIRKVPVAASQTPEIKA